MNISDIIKDEQKIIEARQKLESKKKKIFEKTGEKIFPYLGQEDLDLDNLSKTLSEIFKQSLKVEKNNLRTFKNDKEENKKDNE